MFDRFDPLLTSWRWPVLALVAALAMLGTAHGFEHFAYLLPCPLCLRQREVYWATVAVTLTALVVWRVRPNRRFMLAFNVMIGLIFLTGCVVAAYHAGVEWKFWPAPTGCTGDAVDIGAIDFSDLNARHAVSSCDEAPWTWLGLSMAGWNAVVSMFLALISFRAASLHRARPIGTA